MTGSDEDTLDRARGCLLGQLCGDALGTTLEFSRADENRARYPNGLRTIVGGGPFGLRAGQITDDSELALSLARALVAVGFDEDAIATAYVQWYRTGPFDVGQTTRAALADWPGQVRAADVRQRTQLRNGAPQNQANGALMRISPLAIFGAGASADQLAAWARADATLTHPSDVCVDANVAYVAGLAEAIRGGDREQIFLAALTAPRGDRSVTAALERARNATFPRCDGTGQGWVLLALEIAFRLVLTADRFEDALVQVVMAGGDTDTNAAIAGALLGAHLGETAIPARWRAAVLEFQGPRADAYRTDDARDLARALLRCAP